MAASALFAQDGNAFVSILVPGASWNVTLPTRSAAWPGDGAL
jgi:hypothetical protein